MFRKLAEITPMLTLTLSLASGLHAQDDAPHDTNTVGLTADGTWDCNDDTGNYLGAIVVADQSYAYIDPDGASATYGKLYREHYLAPSALVVIDGSLKEKFGAVGLSLRGPANHPEDYSDWSKVDLNVVISETNMFRCDRRAGT